MKLAFLGTSAFAVPSLLALLEAGHRVLGIVTQPDRPCGRGARLAAPEVKTIALERGLPVHQPGHRAEVADILAALEPELGVVVACGIIFDRRALAAPRLGMINLHASLLPLYRGAAPINWCLRDGRDVTGVTTMHVSPKLDSGDIILQRKVPIGPADDAGSLGEKLARVGASLLGETLAAIEGGRAPRVPQRAAEATYAPALTRSDEALDFSQAARAVVNHVRALSPRPGAYARLGGCDVKVWAAHPAGASGGAQPGTVLGTACDSLLIACGTGSVALDSVQPAGGRSMSGKAFSNGYLAQTRVDRR
ncbi:MAG: methionyl-tRNA formyltransferase [Bacillota bacterium]